MKKHLLAYWTGLALSGALLLGDATRLWAQVPTVLGDDPKVQTENSLMIAWGIVVVFTLGILVVSFRSAKRTHRLAED
ncbi:MAG: hypothetical protein WCI73_09165 [Phycisphaerae bacterium]